MKGEGNWRTENRERETGNRRAERGSLGSSPFPVAGSLLAGLDPGWDSAFRRSGTDARRARYPAGLLLSTAAWEPQEEGREEELEPAARPLAPRQAPGAASRPSGLLPEVPGEPLPEEPLPEESRPPGWKGTPALAPPGQGSWEW